MNETPLNAGTEMDRYIAAKVMGYEFIEIRYFAHDASARQKELRDWLLKIHFRMNRQDDKGLMVGDYYIDVERDICIPVEDFQPSVNMQHAYSALLKLQKQDGIVEISGYSALARWEVRLFQYSKYKGFGAGGTLPLAICRAIGGYYQGERDDRSAE